MEKAFDSLEHNFISATLEKFGFEEDFIQWIRILLCNVTNNGFLMEYFNFNRCTRLGEPLSANLFAFVRTLREEQPLRLLLNLLFYHFNRSEPTYKSQRIALLHVIAACNQLNVNALN